MLLTDFPEQEPVANTSTAKERLAARLSVQAAYKRQHEILNALPPGVKDRLFDEANEIRERRRQEDRACETRMEEVEESRARLAMMKVEAAAKKGSNCCGCAQIGGEAG